MDRLAKNKKGKKRGMEKKARGGKNLHVQHVFSHQVFLGLPLVQADLSVLVTWSCYRKSQLKESGAM